MDLTERISTLEEAKLHNGVNQDSTFGESTHLRNGLNQDDSN